MTKNEMNQIETSIPKQAERKWHHTNEDNNPMTDQKCRRIRSKTHVHESMKTYVKYLISAMMIRSSDKPCYTVWLLSILSIMPNNATFS